ncbi:transcription repressor NadR [Radiobacillus sp. PE A8.2]|uniref:transcription repressor NadR n=1 Tax=Radiobacillus sp. PE A8.2 TaxID=3380349 RepID=UPI0038906AF6
MDESKKLAGDKRRQFILSLLKERNQPITGGELAKLTNVSRQVVVQDISLLKAGQEQIIATSQGYLYLQDNQQQNTYQLTVACSHTPENTRKELELIVDHGVTVKNVFIEHPVYGDLTASIMVSNRIEVDLFIKKVQATNAPYLLQLTEDGVHLHTLESDSEDKLQSAYNSLVEAGFALES